MYQFCNEHSIYFIFQVHGNFVLDIRAHDYIVKGSSPPKHSSVLNFTNINNTTFVGKYYCVSAKFQIPFEVKVLDEYVTYIFVKGLFFNFQF